MQLTWMGTAALLLRQDETTLAVDPFPGLPLEEPVDRAVPAEDRRRFQEAGHVLVTHGHFDHIQFIPALYREKTCPVFATVTPCRTMADHGLPRERLRLRPVGVIVEEAESAQILVRTGEMSLFVVG